MTPTQRTKIWYENRGYIIDVVEHWIRGKRRKDLFGFIDLVAIHKETAYIHWIQATTASNISNRVKKIKSNPYYPNVALTGTVMILGWRELKKEGWQPIVVDVKSV